MTGWKWCIPDRDPTGRWGETIFHPGLLLSNQALHREAQTPKSIVSRLIPDPASTHGCHLQ